MALPLANLAIWANVVPSRLLTPFTIHIGEKERIYMNLNLAYEMWPDVKIPILFVFKDTLPYLVRMFGWGVTFNTSVYFVLHLLSLGRLQTDSLC